jgi:hypothetical protein
MMMMIHTITVVNVTAITTQAASGDDIRGLNHLR